MRITGQTAIGMIFLGTGLGIIAGHEVRGHPLNHALLGSAVAMMVFGAHLISATAVRSALSDLVGLLGRFWPWGKGGGPTPPADGPGV
jgi:hypothetical protein